VGNGAWLLIVVAGIILILFSLLRRRGGPDKYPEVVQALLYDVKLNQALAAGFLQIDKPHRFENTNWQMNKDKIGFLGESLKLMLRESFALVEEFNKKIKESKKTKSDSYRTIDLTRFKELLDKCRQELEDWMVQKTGQKELPPKYPTLLGSIFGER
jgi:hypothetical protein